MARTRSRVAGSCPPGPLAEQPLARPAVELEEQRGLPLVPDPGAHPAVVGVGEEEQQVEPLQAAHALGEGLDQRGLRQVALLRELRHLEVGAHQEHRLLRELLVDAQAVQDAARQDHALVTCPPPRPLPMSCRSMPR